MILTSKNKLILFAILFIGVGRFLEYQYASPTDQEFAASFTIALESKLERLNNALEEMDNSFGFSPNSNLHNTPPFSLLANGLSVFKYEKDTLRFWSDHTVPVKDRFSESGFTKGLLRLGNGWYYAIIKYRENETLVGLVQIKIEFPFENRFLISQFQNDFNTPKSWELQKEFSPESETINLKNEDSFSLLPHPVTISDKFAFTPFFYCCMIGCYLIGFILLLFSMEKLISRGQKNKKSRTAGLVLALLLIRTAMQEFQFPASLYELPLFSPSIYGSSIAFPSLGDLLINTSLILYLVLVFKKHLVSSIREPAKNGTWKILQKTTAVYLGLLLWLLIPVLFTDLVINSKIPYNINNLFELNFYSLVGFSSIAMILFIYYLISWAITAALLKERLKTKSLILLIGSILYMLSAAVIQADVGWQLICPIVLYGIIVLGNPPLIESSNSIKNTRPAFFQIVMIIALFAFATSDQISKNLLEKEQAHRTVLAEKLSAETDPVAEFLFKELKTRIIGDSIIAKLDGRNPNYKQRVITRITQKYLTGYWEKFDIQITICGENDSLNIQPENIVFGCSDFFSKTILDYGKPTATSNFFFLNNNNGRISYLGKFNLKPTNCFIELDSKLIPKNLGFPELLLDLSTSTQLRNDLKLYSYAKYKNGILTEKSGKYQYNNAQKLATDPGTNQFVSMNGFNHLAYQIDETATIILSKEEPSASEKLVRSSYMFSFFCILAILYALTKVSPAQFLHPSFNFRKRIEFSMFFLLLISLIPIGLGTKYYVELQYNKRNHEQLKEKMQSVLVEIEHKLDQEDNLTETLSDYLSYLLTKFSYVFFSDISLYDVDGSLIASSRQEIFNNDLIGGKMNPIAFNTLSVMQKPDFIQNENIGGLNFLSAYIPFRNRDNKLMAYLNLPYFAKEGELRKEISTLVVALVNFYLILIIISIGIALFLSNKITQPLRIIQDKIAQVKLGQHNEIIEWKSNDELGGLVEEYNRMLEELFISAERLAKSERESAWREMAKQVAHEIKNPLTPMKLSVQQLKRAWDEKAPDWELRLKQFSETLVNQIDALSKIAEEFSAFAKMPKAEQAVIDLNKLIQSVSHLFKDQEQSTLTYNTEISPVEANVFVDKEQVLRALNNLINNSADAIIDKEKGEIEITLNEKDKLYIVCVKDNGCGIPEKEKDKIFTPKFTTKSSGMGLGLAIVKNIILHFGGEIWFESKEGLGSSFYFSIPKHLE